MKTREVNGIQITFDKIQDPKCNKATQALLEKMHNIALQGSLLGDKQLRNAIDKNPEIPQFLNYLYVWYETKGEKVKALQANQELVEKFPDYLFGKLSLALDYVNKGQLEQVDSLLGNTFNIQELLPQKKVFHIQEVLAILQLAIEYYLQKDEIESAEQYLLSWEELEEYLHEISLLRLKVNAAKILKNASYRESRAVIPQPKTRKRKTPEFLNPQVNLLYTKKILDVMDIEIYRALPKDTLEQDLVLVLQDSVDRFTYLLNNSQKYDGFFVFNALMLLKDICAYNSFDQVLMVLSQSEEYYEYHFSDLGPRYLWEVIFELGMDQQQKQEDFVKQGNHYTFAKVSFIDALEQLALYDQNERQDVIALFKRVLVYYIQCGLTSKEIDRSFLGLFICSIIDVGGNSLMPEIISLFDLDYIDTTICGNKSSVIEALNENKLGYTREFHDLETIYTMESYQDEPEMLQDDFIKDLLVDSILENFSNSSQQIINNTKINRNDPCPCGSGKKYKKCCLSLLN